MSVGKLPYGPQGREGVIAAIGQHTSQLQSPLAKQSAQSTAEAVLDDVIERIHDQLIMDALVLRIARDLHWEDAQSDLVRQHRSVRFHRSEEMMSTKKIPVNELNHRDPVTMEYVVPGAMEVEKEEVEVEKGAEVEGKMEVVRKMEVEEVNRNGERCFTRLDHVVRPSVADFQLGLNIAPLLSVNEKMKAQLLSAW